MWLGFHDPDGLAAALTRAPNIEWVQLPSAGVDDFALAGLLDHKIMWTSAKGAYSQPVAEHALALIFAMLRDLPIRARAHDWGKPAGTTLHGKRVLIVGAGGIATELLRLLAPFNNHVVIIRRTPAPVPGAQQTEPFERLSNELAEADIVVLAAALTPLTRKLIAAPELHTMNPGAILINIARGGLIDLDALTTALADKQIRGAALDVTEPEPLPSSHPLWKEPRALITPHTADTWDMIWPLLQERIISNAKHFLAGTDMRGQINPAAGY
ncbi:D-isomer specific 2-hydroxyacid dehydrogenase family protein [Subtercola vilae]|uniref:D-isomer specific 2-hydroxyacid dehydrogenase family protein n=1 Tax=Subtercola vilae TaxID=2056433 RepID=UPI002351A3DE|nr:D-isomer specific 2-hydroxyacid dehydrogenase family protein [Subtercola vilae]MEA9986710.1 D-isomer specific 2-hydroxyacid dehydrogenase family protein [Subtercola sp. RTI3]